MQQVDQQMAAKRMELDEELKKRQKEEQRRLERKRQEELMEERRKEEEEKQRIREAYEKAFKKQMEDFQKYGPPKPCTFPPFPQL